MDHKRAAAPVHYATGVPGLHRARSCSQRGDTDIRCLLHKAVPYAAVPCSCTAHGRTHLVCQRRQALAVHARYEARQGVATCRAAEGGVAVEALSGGALRACEGRAESWGWEANSTRTAPPCACGHKYYGAEA